MAKNKAQNAPLDRIETGAADVQNVVIETPKGSRNKFGYDGDAGYFVLKGVLPAGASFPFDFGFLPSTLGEDGDPLDVLLLMDEPAFAGCVVPSRVIGAIEAEQTERDGQIERNDRLIAVAENSYAHRDVRSLDQVSANLMEEIEHFFVSYNTIKGKEFKPLGRFGPERAQQLIAAGQQAWRKKTAKSTSGATKKAKKKAPK